MALPDKKRAQTDWPAHGRVGGRREEEPVKETADREQFVQEEENLRGIVLIIRDAVSVYVKQE